MNCAAFERWLDEGLPQADADHARAHATACPGCAAALAAAEAIEAGLARAVFVAPAHLTDAVMARVAEAESTLTAAARLRITRDAFPWWVRAALDPAVVAAMLLCSLLVWQWDAIARAGMGAAAWLAQAGAGASLPSPAPSLGLQIVLAMLLVPVSLWVARAAFQTSERWVARAAGRRI